MGREKVEREGEREDVEENMKELDNSMVKLGEGQRGRGRKEVF